MVIRYELVQQLAVEVMDSLACCKYVVCVDVVVVEGDVKVLAYM